VGAAISLQLCLEAAYSAELPNHCIANKHAVIPMWHVVQSHAYTDCATLLRAPASTATLTTADGSQKHAAMHAYCAEQKLSSFTVYTVMKTTNTQVHKQHAASPALLQLVFAFSMCGNRCGRFDG